MTRRHRVAAEWVPEEPPEWAACRLDSFGGGRIALLSASLTKRTGKPLTDDEVEEYLFERWDGLLRRFTT